MSINSINGVFEAFNKLKVIIVGDVMLDVYLHGSIERMSPEDSSVPVLRTGPEDYRLGGAANVALNLKVLGASPFLIGPIGEDRSGVKITSLLTENAIDTKGLLVCQDRLTTVKKRIFDNHRQVLRIDNEDTHYISDEQSDLIVQSVKHQIMGADMLLIQDYDKGCLTSNLIHQLLAICHEAQCPVAVDPKFDHFHDYLGVTLLKPNFLEFSKGLGYPKLNPTLEDMSRVAATYIKDQTITHLIVSLSKDGMYYNDGSMEGIHPAIERNIRDVSGAGDTVFAVSALCVCLGLPIAFAAGLANIAGGLVCEEHKVSPVSVERLMNDADLDDILQGYLK